MEFINISTKTLKKCRMLSTAEKAALMDGIISYATDGTIPDDMPQTVLLMLQFITEEMDFSKNRYDEHCRKNKERKEKWKNLYTSNVKTAKDSFDSPPRAHNNNNNNKKKNKKDIVSNNILLSTISKEIESNDNNKLLSSSSKENAQKAREEEDKHSMNIDEDCSKPFDVRKQKFYEQVFSTANSERYDEDKLLRFYAYYSEQTKEGLMLWEDLKYHPTKGRRGMFDIPRRLARFR